MNVSDYEPRKRDPWEVQSTINCHAMMAQFVYWSDRFAAQQDGVSKIMMAGFWTNTQDWANYGLSIGSDERSLYRNGECVASWAVIR